MPMRDDGNEAVADNMLSWLAGYPFGVDYTRGYPRSNPGEFTAVVLLARREADAALIVDADPWTTISQAAIDHLELIPHVRIAPIRERPQPTARVPFTTASPGIDSGSSRTLSLPKPKRRSMKKSGD